MQTSSPSLNPQPEGPHNVTGTLVHLVLGVSFVTFAFEREHTSLGHFVHEVLDVYPELSSLHFSSCSVLQAGTSSSTSCFSFVVTHSLSYCVEQISSPSLSQSLTRGVRHTSTVTFTAALLYSMKHFLTKSSLHSSS